VKRLAEHWASRANPCARLSWICHASSPEVLRVLSHRKLWSDQSEKLHKPRKFLVLLDFPSSSRHRRPGWSQRPRPRHRVRWRIP